MPHVFVNRLRLFSSPAIPVSLEELRREHFWEAINSVFYVLGGLLLIVGSVLFLPKYGDVEWVGAYIFIVASVLYLTVSGHDLVEIMNHGGAFQRNLADVTAAACYSIGAINFILGSIFFLPEVEMFKAGAFNFIIGSVLFVVGAFVNSLQIFDSPSRLTAFYANLVAVSYVVGSTMYLCASVPYLFDLHDQVDSDIVYRFCATLYIWGSILFTIGGVLNMYRARLIMIIEKAKHHNNSRQYTQLQERKNSPTTGLQKSPVESDPMGGGPLPEEAEHSKE